MANPQLSVEIGAKITGLTKGMSDAAKAVSNFSVDAQGNIIAFDKSIQTLERQLKTFQNGLKSSLDPSRIKTLNSAIDITKQKIQQTSRVINNAGFKGLTTGSNQAAMALTDFNRIMQDAPFGIIAVQNNFNPLLESFQRLRAVTGSNGEALKLLAGSLMGPAGIGFALSLVTAGLTFFAQYMQKSKKETEEAANINEDYGKSLDAVSRGLLKGAQDADRALIPLSLLYKASQDLTLSDKERLKAVDALQKQHPKTFGNLTDEFILAGKAAGAYDELTKSIIAKAKASALEDELKDNAKLLRTLEKRGELTVEALKLAKDQDAIRIAGINNDVQGLALAKAKNQENIKEGKLLNLNNKERFNSEKTDEGIVLTAKDSYQLQTEILGIEREKSAALKVQESLTKGIYDIVKESGVDAIIDIDKTETSIKKLKSLKEILDELNTALKVNSVNQEASFYEKLVLDLDDYQKAINSLIENGFKKEGKEVEALTQKYTDLFSVIYQRGGRLEKPGSQVLTGLAPTKIPIATVDFSKANTEIGAQLTEWKMKMADFNKSASNILSSGISDAFGSLGQSIGEALAGGGNFIENAGAALLGIIGNIATSLGKAAIGIGVGMLAIKAAFKNPLTAISAGIALVALGSFISNKVANITNGENQQQTRTSSAIPRFATGVNNFSGGLAMVGERGAELVNLPTGSSVIPNDRTNRILAGSNKSQSVQIFGEVGFDMEQFVIRFRNAERRLERSGA